jgi:arsenite methyltransferase
MSVTPASAEYFERVAGQWDSLRSSYFSEAVRVAAIRKAYLRPEMVVADVGAGTGFMTAGLAPLVRKVYVLDGSASMLAVARQNLKGFDNLVFQEVDGLSLPLADNSLDVAFANMYLHHMPDPLAAIRELARVLRPAGRLVITDMDSHPYEWLKEEMADVWLGFERSQIRRWFEQAGLVNIIVASSGESCQAKPEKPALQDTAQREANISVFVATGTRRIPGVKDMVRADYGAAAEGKRGCCSPGEATGGSGSCCTSESGANQLIQIQDETDVGFIPDYSGYTLEEQAQVPVEAAEISLGCGNPTAMAGLKPGEVVLDIGSGGGMDAFLAARQVGPAGKVIGVDMTPAMLARARHSAESAGLLNVEFRYGQAEDLPVQDETVDVVISNCVINLTEDKGKVFAEIFRTLKPGGRLEVSDVLTDRSFPIDLLQDPSNWPGCVVGALPEREYLDLVEQAGFREAVVRRSASYDVESDVRIYSAQVSARKPQPP